MSYFDRHIAPVSRNPNSRAPLFPNSTYLRNNGRIGGAIACQPRHTSSNSLGSRLVRRIVLSSSRSRHFPGVEQYFPSPYIPSIRDAISVNSWDSFGSDGAAKVNEIG